jgi:hypothetical protein
VSLLKRCVLEQGFASVFLIAQSANVRQLPPT